MKSHLQQAADRVREIKIAVEKTEGWMAVCEEEYQKAKMAFAEAERNLNDTKSFLFAQQCKLNRELNSVGDIVSGCNDATGGDICAY